jgi:CubicO group peptidase (beta-lactamase class C family)
MGIARRHRRATVGAAAAVILLVTASCGGGSSAAATTATTSALKPIDQTALQALVDTTMADRMIPGGLVLLRGPQSDYLAAYGTTELGAETAPTADTHVRIGSVSKSMTAASILLLAQGGTLSLADPISKFVPEVPDGDTITIAQLLEMRSGLYNYTDDPVLRAVSTPTISGCGHPRNCWPSRSPTRPTSLRAPTTSTATLITRSWGWWPSEQTANRWPPCCRIGCSDPSA